jgi:hypothetical protein
LDWKVSTEVPKATARAMSLASISASVVRP